MSSAFASGRSVTRLISKAQSFSRRAEVQKAEAIKESD
jgi:hypothetical protein